MLPEEFNSSLSQLFAKIAAQIVKAIQTFKSIENTWIHVIWGRWFYCYLAVLSAPLMPMSFLKSSLCEIHSRGWRRDVIPRYQSNQLVRQCGCRVRYRPPSQYPAWIQHSFLIFFIFRASWFCLLLAKIFKACITWETSTWRQLLYPKK